ncbi:MAG: BrnT family toxin [Bacteroidota bacterium]
MQYNFEWDPEKARINHIKHGVAFEDAAQIFLDTLAISVYDEEHSVHEERWITIGKAVGDRLLVVVHGFTEQPPDECTIRIISARRATRREQIQYEG